MWKSRAFGIKQKLTHLEQYFESGVELPECEAKVKF